MLGTCVALPAARAADAPRENAVKPQTEEMAPGVWRLRFGQPETFTPLRFRSAPPRLAGFAALPSCSIPLDIGQISFAASARGCAVELPMVKDERIYGFGLNSRLFEMTTGQAGKDHPGRHVFLRPTDSPENDLNDSHAPVPFYVSTRGYGVYVEHGAVCLVLYRRRERPLPGCEGAKSPRAWGLPPMSYTGRASCTRKRCWWTSPLPTASTCTSSAVRPWAKRFAATCFSPAAAPFRRSGAWALPIAAGRA